MEDTEETNIASLAPTYKNKASGTKIGPPSVEVTEATSMVNLAPTYRNKASGMKLSRYP